MFKTIKKYRALLSVYESHIKNIFVFLKYPYQYDRYPLLESPSLSTLYEFILGPWTCENLFQIFARKAIEFSMITTLR
jgi:hypothetical protein